MKCSEETQKKEQVHQLASDINLDEAGTRAERGPLAFHQCIQIGATTKKKMILPILQTVKKVKYAMVGNNTVTKQLSLLNGVPISILS